LAVLKSHSFTNIKAINTKSSHRPSIMLSATSQTFVIASLLHSSSAAFNLFQPRIIGGITAPAQRYPYTVALTYGGSDFFCGGSLIAPDVVLTAAHCIGGGSYSVAVGRDDLTSNDGEEIAVAQEIRHPEYSWDTDENDFALLLLSESVSVLSEEELVRINSDPAFPAAGDLARTMGWGDTDPDDASAVVSDELLEVDLPVISNEECSAAKGTDNGYTDSYDTYIFDSMLCTFEPGQDACQGEFSIDSSF
jgi:secreted trypsin-like serine protease